METTKAIPGSRLSERHPAVDEMRLAGDLARLVGGEENRERGDLGGLPKPAHGLAIDEPLAYVRERAAGLARQRRDALLERQSLDGSGADRVHPEAVLDEIGSDRLRQSDNAGFGRPIGVSVGHAADRGNRG